MAIQFDTLRYVEKLKSASIPEAQAKAKAEALATVLGKATSGLLATKDDITDIKFGIADVKTDPKLMKWMLITLIVGVLSLVAKVFF